ncbi:MAG: hypothetical protein R2752_02005 [Vicinamibacterales bacterium]
MIVAAALGATVAFWIARTEQGAARRHRQLTRAQMVEISLRQAIVGDLGFRANFESYQRANRGRAAAFQEDADRIRAADPEQAGQLEIRAQQELQLSRLTGTLLAAFRDWGSGNAKAQIDARVTEELSRLGFATAPAPAAPHEAPGAATPAAPEGTGAPDGDAPPTGQAEARDTSYDGIIHARQLPLWAPLMAAIEDLHHHIPLLAIGVVLFVAALVALTFADLLAARPAAANVALLAGAAAMAGALIAVIIWDTSTWLPLALVAVASGGIGLGLRALGAFSVHTDGDPAHPPELEPRQFAGAHVVLHHARNLRERALVALTAVTVLLSSVVGWWYADALTQANEATHRAFASEVELNNLTGERWLVASGGAITAALELFNARTRCTFATQAAALPPSGTGPGAQAILEADRDRECRALGQPPYDQQATFVDEADFDSGDQPGSRIFAEIRNRGPVNPSQLYALADGYISLAEAWETKSVIYVFGLTLFAIALYLLSQSTSMGENLPGFVLAASGTVLAAATFGYALHLYRQPVMAAGTLPEGCAGTGTPVELAAAFYGDATRIFDAAATGEDYQKAADLLSCAVAVRPDFARAQYDRSRAASLISQGDLGNDYTSFPTRARVAEIQASYAEMVAVLERGGWTPTTRLLNSYGFNTILAALADGDRARLDEAVSILERGLAVDGIATPDGTVDAVRLTNATSTQVDHSRLLLTNLALARLARNERQAAAAAYRALVDGLHAGENQPLVGSSLSDLNILAGHCAALYGDAAAETCASVADGIADARRMLLVGRSAPVEGGGRTAVTQAAAWIHPSRAGWSARASGFDARRDTFAVVWSSYSDDWGVWRVVQPLFRTVDPRRLQAGGVVSDVTVYDSSPSYCLPPGRYRAEFFLNGRPLGDGAPEEFEMRGYRNYRSREMDVAMCVPDDWTLSDFRQNDEGRHLVRAFTTPNNRSALYVFTFFTPKHLAGTGTAAPLDRGWSMLKRLTRNPPADALFYQAASKFQGCGAPIPGGTILSRTWTAGDGLVHVAMVMGDFAPNGQACQVLESIGAYYDRDTAQLLDASGSSR